MTSQTSLRQIDAYWATFFGCTVDDLHSAETIILPHAALEGYPGITLFRHGSGCIISVPQPLLKRLSGRLSLPPTEIFDPVMLASILGGAVRQIIGPTAVYYVDSDHFVSADTLGTRLLSAADDAALRVLAGSMSRTEWEHGGIEFGHEPLMGLMVHNRLVAAGRLEPRSESIADLGVVVARSERGQGYGRAVASALTAWGIERNVIVQYRTLMSNSPSMAIAQSLGYRPYAETISAQLNRV